MERTGLSRREALSAGGGTAAGLLLGRVAFAEADTRRFMGVKRADVVVVGAGISGLTAARQGCMDGAVSAGERAAKEAVDAL